jgi:hypothetical protein
MGLIRTTIGAIVGGIILYNEGWPLHYIIVSINLPSGYRLPALLLLIGIVAGFIAGSSLWGIISGIGVFPLAVIYFYVILQGREVTLEYLTVLFQNFGLDKMLYLGLGGFLGGALFSSITKSDDYVLVRIKR